MALAKSYWALPGPRGPAGTNGVDGADGEDGYTRTTAGFNMPAEGANVTVPVISSVWAAIGMIVYIQGAGHMQIASKPTDTQLTLTNLEVTATGAYAANVAPGTAVADDTLVSPAGLQGTAGVDGTGGADADGHYLVTRAADSPVNAVNLGTATTGLLKLTTAVGIATPTTVPSTAYGESVLNAANAAAGIALLGLGTISTQAANNVAITGGSVAGINDITVADGGTGSSTAGGARTNLGVAASGANSDITSLTGLTTPLSIAQGGTAGATAAAARLALDLDHCPNGCAIICEQQNAGTNGGTFTAGAWQTRALNTEVIDEENFVSLAASQMTLLAGTYIVRAIATAFDVNNHKIRLRNITAATTLGVGMTTRAAASTSASFVDCHFTLAVNSVLELQHYCETTKATTGFGTGFNTGEVEIYARVFIIREAG